MALSAEERRLQEHLLEFLTPARRDRLREVLAMRTRRLAVVLEDVHSSHNSAAVIRSCDAFGVQDVHVIETFNEYETRASVALGSEQWVTIHRYLDSDDPRRVCLTRLRDCGFRIVATTPHAGSRTPQSLDLSQPCAVVFGAEKEGVSEVILAEADELLTIPMHGFVESLNISVAAAICLQELSRRVRTECNGWGLSDEEKEELFLEWTRRSVPNVEAIAQRFRMGGG
ncbi:MAG: TrmH family RNA methyltransferase [Planctomycetota bacterium]|nr:MAG: TrmH family RNA methyltransferase [Planctomycetota bacterium]